MKFFTALGTLSFMGSALAAAVLHSRTVVKNHGTIVSPASNSHVASETPFPFDYTASDWCQDGYSAVTVWLTDYEPTASNVDSQTGNISPVLHSFGTFTKPNFGLPPMSDQIPSSLTPPDLTGAGISSGDKLYLTVVERAANCPPGGQPAQYGFTSASIIYT